VIATVTVTMIGTSIVTTTGIMIEIGRIEVIAIADDHSPAEREGPPDWVALFHFRICCQKSFQQKGKSSGERVPSTE
jgi:hypothetical protein